MASNDAGASFDEEIVLAVLGTADRPPPPPLRAPPPEESPPAPAAAAEEAAAMSSPPVLPVLPLPRLPLLPPLRLVWTAVVDGSSWRRNRACVLV